MANIESPLSKLALDYWYHVVLVVSTLIFILCGAGVLVAFPTAPTASISAGFFFIALGEWINHPIQTKFVPQSIDFPSGVLTGHPRSNKPIGLLFVLIGIVVGTYGAFLLFTG